MDGNEMDLLIAGINNAKTYLGKGKPIVILMKTEMGYGIDFMKGNFEWHGVAPNDEQLKVALNQLPVTLEDY
jgi:transketolase